MIDETVTGADGAKLAEACRNRYRSGMIASDKNASRGKVSTVTAEAAEAMAVSALGLVAGDPVLLPRFLALTGIDAGQIRAAAGEPGFLAGVLDFVLAHEPTLMAFAEDAGVEPAAVARARHALAPGDDRHERST